MPADGLLPGFAVEAYDSLPSLPDDFGAAVRDYRWLLDRGYPDSALKLVGDRYRLAKDERLILFRGVASAEWSRKRACLIGLWPPGGNLAVDGYNQIYTVMHYFSGKRLFLSTDGYLRDAGAAHGRIGDIDRFRRAIDLVAAAASTAAEILVFLDAPVSGSGAHAALIREVFDKRGVSIRTQVVPSADYLLKALPSGTVAATADSAIIDTFSARREKGEVSVMVIDLARRALEAAFGPKTWLDLRTYLELPSSPGNAQPDD